MDVAVVGGGITGLVTTAALIDGQATQGRLRVTNYERMPEIGGVLRDITVGDHNFFSGCQYLEDNGLVTRYLKSNFLCNFKHRYGSYTQLFGETKISTISAVPTISAASVASVTKALNPMSSLADRLRLYDPRIAKALLSWTDHLGLQPHELSWTSAVPLGINRVLICDSLADITNLRLAHSWATDLYAIPRPNLGLEWSVARIPRYGFNKFFEDVALEFPVGTIQTSSRVRAHLTNKGEVKIGLDGRTINCDLIIWCASPTELVKLVQHGKRLASKAWKTRVTAGLVSGYIDVPLYIQVYSLKSSITRIYVYPLGPQGGFAIEQSINASDQACDLSFAEKVLRSFGLGFNLEPVATTVTLRWDIFSPRDMQLLSQTASALERQGFIDGGWHLYGREQKCNYIFGKMKRLIATERTL